MCWYNILGDNKVSISHILWIDPITAGSVLLTTNLVELKRIVFEPILTVKRTERRKLVDHFGLYIEANPSRLDKNNIYIFHIGYIPGPSSVNLHV